MGVDTWISEIDSAGERIVEVLGDVDLAAPVPSCPGWDMGELVRHLGGVHRWATTFVVTGRTTPIREDQETQVGGWPQDDQLKGWFEEGVRSLAAGLRAAPEDLVCWTFLEAETPLKHWARRQAHETAIHRVDAELAAGADVHEFQPAFAADGVDEFLTAFINRPRRGPRSEVPRSLAFSCTDIDRVWTVDYDDTAAVTKRAVDQGADANVGGTAADLYLWVWGRLRRDGVDLDAPPDVIDDWNTITDQW